VGTEEKREKWIVHFQSKTQKKKNPEKIIKTVGKPNQKKKKAKVAKEMWWTKVGRKTGKQASRKRREM